MKLDLINNESDRDLVMQKENSTRLLDMLRKFGTVVDYMTEQMVAKFYGVDNGCIHNYGTRNGEELKKYGYRVLKGEELKEFKKGSNQFDSSLKYASQIRLYPIEAVVVVGMMLTESKVAEQLRSEIIKELFSDNKPSTLTRKEELILSLYNSKGGQDAIFISKELTAIEVEEATKPLIEKNEKLENEVAKLRLELTNIKSESIQLGEFGVWLKSHNPSLKIGKNLIFKFCKDKGYVVVLYKQNHASSFMVNNGYFENRSELVDTKHGIRDNNTIFITKKGMIRLIKEIYEEQLGDLLK